MRIARLTACATCALHLLDTVIYNQKSVLQFLPTSQVQQITIENKDCVNKYLPGAVTA